ncbi:hypothetical protein [Propionivibrio sp.]|uniref:hypothetical protein n=1 Tax=Propionivibrio sp. TaxID=2212460 RepID=UPI0039E59F77
MDESPLHARDSRWSKGLIVTGITIAVLNMVLAWILMFLGPSPQSYGHAVQAMQSQATPEASTVPSRQTQGNATAGVARNDEMTDSSGAFVTRLFEIYQRMAQSEERQATLLLGFCFALISIGFSLFVMGIEGASAFRGSAAEFGSLAIKVSSPGLFCILLASLLIALNLVKWTSGASAQPFESKADAIRAESDGKEQVLRAEAEAKERIIQADALAKENYARIEAANKVQIIDAETQAKKDVIEAEALAKERVLGKSGAR